MKTYLNFKKTFKYKRFLGLAFCLLPFAFINGCKKFLDIPPPANQLVTTNVFNSDASATSAQLAIYANMWNNSESWYMASNMGIYADELQSYSTDQQALTPLYTNNLTGNFELGWGANYGFSPNNYYAYIYAANAAISGLQSVGGTSAVVRQQLIGEAYFVRAYWHFYLSNIFGAVPLVLTTDYTVNGTIARTPRVQVLRQVISDLETAKGLLNSNYVDASDTIVTTERVRPNKAAAEALLARAYLYLGDYDNANIIDYQKADSCATAVIGNPTYNLSSINGVFLKNSSETIWQLQTPSTAGNDTQDGARFILTAAPSTGSNSYATVSNQLFNSFEAGDQRKSSWIGSITEGGATYYFPYKYKVTNGLQNKEYEMMLRLGEQYLIRAEARMHEGDLTGAAADLNMIRTRAGLPPTIAVTAADLQAAILHERQVELFTEWGARWFDLCRTGNAPSVMGSPGNVCQAKGGIWAWDNHQLLWPIPQKDMSADPNLKQNSGY